MDGPGAGLHLVGRAQALQALQAANQQQALALQSRLVEAFDMHQAIVAQLALQGLLDLQLGARPQPFGRQFGGAISPPPAPSSTATARSRQAQRTRKPARLQSAR